VILADTSAWVEYDRATGSAVDQRLTALIATDGMLAVTEPVVMEVLAGARSGRQEAELRRLLLRFHLLRIDASADFAAATGIYRRCRSAGITPRGMIDCMIVAVAWRRGAAVLARDADLSRVHYVRLGSAPASEKLVEDIRAVFPKAVVSSAYGTTEAGPIVFGPHPDGRPKPALVAGWPMPGVEVCLVDADGLDAVEGVLWQRSPANMRGYLNLPEKSREVLTTDGWYISGDVFRRDANGAYSFVGRADDMFICGGENIYPSEVERMLEQHPDILQSCVVPVPDEIKGEKPVAFIVPRSGAKLSEGEVKQYALAHAPAYQHPRRVTFLEDLPLSGTNKVDRNALRRRAQEEGLAATAEVRAQE